MCWSATADLVMGSAIVGLGAIGLALARDRRDVPLAALPVLLGAHQLIESRIWAESSGTGAEVRGAAVTAWTVIAFVVLPVYVPLVLLVAERHRRRIQWATALVGLAVSVPLAVSVLSGVHATDDGHVMDYGVGIAWLPLFLVGYLVATCVPFLTSAEPRCASSALLSSWAQQWPRSSTRSPSPASGARSQPWSPYLSSVARSWCPVVPQRRSAAEGLA